MNYNDLVTQVSQAVVVASTNTDFTTSFPNWIAYAENRIYRELNLLDAYIRDSSSSLTANSRNFNLPTSAGTFLVVDGLNAITPAGATADGGTRVPLLPTTRDFLDFSWPSATGATVPAYFAYISQNTYISPPQTQIIVGPWPDANYRIEVYGRFQPAPISATNLSSWLTDNLWDLMFAATMIAATSWQQNFGAAGADNPQMANAWEATYTTLKESAIVLTACARLAGASWTPKPVEPTAQPQRG